jgi:predicted Zn-dependent peptidase
MSFFAKMFGVKSRKVHPGLRSSSSSSSRSSASSRTSKQHTRKAKLLEKQADLNETISENRELIEDFRKEWINIPDDEKHKLKKDAVYKKLIRLEKTNAKLNKKLQRTEDLTEASLDTFSKIENMKNVTKDKKRDLKKQYVALQDKFKSTLNKGSRRNSGEVDDAMKKLNDFEELITSIKL